MITHGTSAPGPCHRGSSPVRSTRYLLSLPLSALLFVLLRVVFHKGIALILETNVALLKMELVLFLKHVPMRLTHELREPFHLSIFQVATQFI